ncbi:topoisomerase DNA-binding C4 zinc finger domain-containing protein [Sulfurimonas sp. NW15]|uniref:topoisomerase DNA-binding C4 zinc finger domain-containing protein n=1 Tax=Sulfurimonas sp. NW15 TaxID=2922729 RepID=UPI003DA867D2
MEKLYIPTTTLNFNNILSTESISPKSFYENRNFGYKRFEIVEPSRLKHSLIAYTKIPYFEINDDELDNYPLIIEISKDMIKDLNIIDKINSIEVFQISQTIYLHPNKVKFLFLNEEHKRITLIKAEPSIETKLLPLYQTKIEIINKADSFKWEEKYLEKIIEENIDIKQHIYNDVLINKIKGFYFCYTLGEIYLNSIIKNNINETLDDNKYKRQQAQENADYQVIYKINEEENKHLEKMIKSSKVAVYKTLNLNNNKLTSFANHNDISELYKNIINDIICFDRINSKEDFKIDRFELLKKIGDNFKDTNFDGKDKSIEYIRNLMKNIKNYEPFEAESVDIKNYDILLKSIAYFILRGDDLEKLLNVLKENNMKTFKMAFGLCGALFGFSAIPKTISNVLFKEENNNIIDIQDFLQNMYVKIHNIDENKEIKISSNRTRQIQENLQAIQTKSEPTTIIEDTPLKCPDCGGGMVERISKKDGKYKSKKFFGCRNFPNCRGVIWNESDKSIMSKVIDHVKKPLTNDNNLDNIIYDFIKEQSGKVKIADARKVIKIKTNKEFKDRYLNDKRFECYKEKNTEMIRIK